MVMLGIGGASGLINMSYALNSTVHNTQWVTGHFHLIYGGSVVIMYFAIVYELWPRLTGRPLIAPLIVTLQLWSWFVGMLVVTLPWHVVGVMGQPRRMAYYDFNDPALAPQAIWVSTSAVGGFVLVVSAVLLIGVLLASHAAAGLAPTPHILARGRSAALAAGLFEWVRSVDTAGGGPDRRELRLPDRAICLSSEHGRASLSGASPLTRDRGQAAPDPRFTIWIGATIALFIVAVSVGFILLPSAQPGALNLWSAICRAVGLPSENGRAAGSPIAGQPASTVAWTVATCELLTQGGTARGAALATTCNNCHGANGVSNDAAIPNLVGQTDAAIYKQLVDFKEGRRSAAVMGVYVASLLRVAMVDLAAYYASLPAPSREQRRHRSQPIPLRAIWLNAAVPCGVLRRAPRVMGRWASRLTRPTCKASSAPTSNSRCRRCGRVAGTTTSASRCVASRAI